MASHLTVINPLKEAIEQTRDLDEVAKKAGSRDWRRTCFCWSCLQDKPAKGAKRVGFRAPGTEKWQGPIKSICADCLAKKERSE